MREALDARQLSQADLARRLGVRAATVTDWFTQGRAPSGLIMLRLPTVLDVDPGWLFSGTGSMHGPSPASTDGHAAGDGAGAPGSDSREVLDELRRLVRDLRAAQPRDPAADD